MPRHLRRATPLPELRQSHLRRATPRAELRQHHLRRATPRAELRTLHLRRATTPTQTRWHRFQVKIPLPELWRHRFQLKTPLTQTRRPDIRVRLGGQSSDRSTDLTLVAGRKSLVKFIRQPLPTPLVTPSVLPNQFQSGGKPHALHSPAYRSPPCVRLSLSCLKKKAVASLPFFVSFVSSCEICSVALSPLRLCVSASLRFLISISQLLIPNF